MTQEGQSSCSLKKLQKTEAQRPPNIPIPQLICPTTALLRSLPGCHFQLQLRTFSSLVSDSLSMTSNAERPQLQLTSWELKALSTSESQGQAALSRPSKPEPSQPPLLKVWLERTSFQTVDTKLPLLH